MRPQIVLFGDSNTEFAFAIAGWAAGLAESYSRRADVIVRGYHGYNTRWALFLLDRIFPRESSTPPVATVVFFGANDAAISGRSSSRQHVPVEEYKENLRKIVSHLKECSPKMVVVLITPPPINEDVRLTIARGGDREQCTRGLSIMDLPDRTNAMTGFYAQKCIDLAQELGLPCVDLWNKMQRTENWEKEFLYDGLHLTCQGNHYVRKAVCLALGERGLCPSRMPYDFPRAADVNDKDLEKSFQQ